MDGLIRNAYQEQPCKVELCRRQSQREILVERQNHLKTQLEEVNAALDFFDSNPTFEKGLDVLARALR